MSLATPFVYSKAVLAQDLPGNHRGGRSRFFGSGFLWEGCAGGICSTRIDFQLGTNAADSNGLKRQREVCWQKILDVRLASSFAYASTSLGNCSIIEHNPTGGHRWELPGARVLRGVIPNEQENCAEKNR
ncbi:hypothetical protein [Pseudomonas umsongensis]|uniref:hypothetical protein n=1 Tax=Pseudomonas umsongensis TaxID=198618 RepID=UPI0015BB6464|nr:hypothetical protein [Pseudomonas umsongensis]